MEVRSQLANGYWGKILRINLTGGTIKVENYDEKFYRTYVGGSGFSAYFLAKELAPGIDPLGPENKLIFSAGPLTGLPIPGGGRHSIGAKSPLTGGFGDSQAGGFWGAAMKHAGWDGIIVEGAAKKPVYIAIKDGDVQIKDASHFWGKGGGAAIDAIHAEPGMEKARVSYIGQAGENLVRVACIGHDLKNYAGRCGLGAVMGSKKLKAIAVVGTQKVPVADSDKIKEMTQWMVKNGLGGTKSLHDYGTPGLLPGLNNIGCAPTFNFRQGHFDKIANLTGAKMNETILKEGEGCYACPVRCKRVVEAEKPYKLDSRFGGPEYETIGALGHCCGIDDLNAVAMGNQLCSDYGLDSIGAGVSIAFAMECFEEGILTKKDTDGLDLRFGKAEAMIEMVKRIALRQGLGDLLAEGTKWASAKIGRGSEKFAMQIKGQELPMHDPKPKNGLGIGYAVSPTGADHCHNIHDSRFLTEAGVAPYNALGVYEPIKQPDLSMEKVRLTILKSAENWFFNCATMCQFVPWSPTRVCELLKAATGWDTSVVETMKVSERLVNLSRIFNLREGFTKKDDAMPERLFKPFRSGPIKGIGIKKSEFKRGDRLVLPGDGLGQRWSAHAI